MWKIPFVSFALSSISFSSFVLAKEATEEQKQSAHYDALRAETRLEINQQCNQLYKNIQKFMTCATERSAEADKKGLYRGTRAYCERHYLGRSTHSLRLKWIEVRDAWKDTPYMRDELLFGVAEGVLYKEHYQDELDCLSDELKERGAYRDRRNPRGLDWMNMTVEEFQARFPEDTSD